MFQRGPMYLIRIEQPVQIRRRNQQSDVRQYALATKVPPATQHHNEDSEKAQAEAGDFAPGDAVARDEVVCGHDGEKGLCRGDDRRSPHGDVLQGPEVDAPGHRHLKRAQHERTHPGRSPGWPRRPDRAHDGQQHQQGQCTTDSQQGVGTEAGQAELHGDALGGGEESGQHDQAEAGHVQRS